MFNDWIWVCYTPGAGGKLLAVLLQFDDSVDQWYDYTDLDTFISERFVPHENQIETEPVTNLDVRWYTRQLPFTRGDDLTTEQAWNYYIQANDNTNNIKVVQWHKPYLPKWYNGRTISIRTDEKSTTWLRNRRDHLFYTWNGNTVTLKRFLSRRGNAKKYADDPQTEYVYVNKDDFYQKEFYTDPEVTGCCETDYTIMLDSFLHQDSAEMIKSINANMNLNINIDKGSVLVDKWRSLNEKFYG